MGTTSTKLALLGGDRAVTLDQTEAMRWPPIDEEALAAVEEVIREGNWSTPPLTRQFETEFASYLGVRYALAHNNGTAALHAAVFSLGIGPGDEVIVPTQTPWFTVMPVLHVGAIPVFADCDPATANIDPADIARRITPRSKAVAVTHVGGRPVEMQPVLTLARQHGLKVIEDASHAHGASYQGSKIGSLGDVAAFSMQTGKLMPAGEAGVFVTNHRDLYERAVLLGHYERIDQSFKAGDRALKETSYGHKYRASPINIAIGRVSLAKLDERNRQRAHNQDYLLVGLAEVPGLTPEHVPEYMTRVYWRGASVHYDAAEFGHLPMDRFMEALQAEGVNVRRAGWWRKSLHLQPLFVERKHWAYDHPANADSLGNLAYGEGTLPVSEQPTDDRFRIPTFPHASRELLDQYIGAFQKVARHVSDLL